MRTGAGKFNKRGVIQRIKPHATENDAGHVDLEDDSSWETYCTVWLQVLPRGGREFFQAKQTRSDLTHLMRVLWSTMTNTITSRMRVRMDDAGVTRTINLLDVYEVEETNREIELHGVEVK